MVGLLVAFSVIGSLICLGALLSGKGIIDIEGQRVLGRLAFRAATPALILTTVSEADLPRILSLGAVATIGGTFISGALYLVIARCVLVRTIDELIIGFLASTYVNVGNLGIPLAVQVFGSAELLVPTFLLQFLIVQPLALALLDRDATTGLSLRTVLLRNLANPLTLGAILGAGISASQMTLPPFVLQPLEVLGGMAVPAVLLAYGASLHRSPSTDLGGSRSELLLTVVIKLVLQPLVTLFLGRGLGLSGEALLSVVLFAALPTAHNVFVHATHYRCSVSLARSTILLTTLCAGPITVALALALQ